MKNIFLFLLVFQALGQFCLGAEFYVYPKGVKSFYAALKKHGFSSKQQNQVLSRNQKARYFTLQKDIPYLVKNYGAQIEIKFFDQFSKDTLVFWKNKTQVGWKLETQKYNVQTTKYRALVQGSVIGTIVKMTNSEWVARQFIDAFQSDYDVRKKVRAGSPMYLVVEKYYRNGKFIRFGEVTEAGLQIDGRIIGRKLVRYPGGAAFVGLDQNHFSRPFYSPVSKVNISSLFQKGRYHPIRHKRQAHLGVDYEAPEGTPVYSVKSGYVKRMGTNRAAGNYIVIDHGNGYETSYNHLYSLTLRLKAGKKVQAGEMIGTVGSTGYSTRPHLHFAVRLRGQYVDPLKLVRSFPAQVEPYLARYIASN